MMPQKIRRHYWIPPLLLLVISASMPCAALGAGMPVLRFIDTSGDHPTFYALDLPYYAQETGESGGVAALRMAMAYYGYPIDESEFIRVARTSYLWWNTGTNGWDMLRAAHFSHDSSSYHDVTLKGYTGKWFGFDSAAGVIMAAYHNDTREDVLSTIKELLLKDVVLLFAMWYAGDQDFVREVRVLQGFDDRTNELVFADSWGNPTWRTSYEDLFEYWWLNGGQPAYWIQGVFPWQISLLVTSISGTDYARVNATVETNVPEWWRSWPDFESWREVSGVDRCYLSDTRIELSLPSGFSLLEGQSVTDFEYNSDGNAEISWLIEHPSEVHESDTLEVEVFGYMNGRSPTYGPYKDVIYSAATQPLSDSAAPTIGPLEISEFSSQGIKIACDVQDASPIRSAVLRYRSEAANWSYVQLYPDATGLWRAESSIGLPLGNLTQLQVLVEDDYGNNAESPLYECDWTDAQPLPASLRFLSGLQAFAGLTLVITCVVVGGLLRLRRLEDV
jgi:hypothetical protein